MLVVEYKAGAPTAALFRPDRASDELIVQAVLLPKASIVHVCKKSRKGSREYYRGDPFVLSGEPLLQC